MKPHGFAAAFAGTLRSIITDKGVLLMLVVAPLIYSFFYPWPYNTELARKVPAAIVDYDQSTLSRHIVRLAAASPRLDVHVVADERTAQEALWKQEIYGYLVLPANLKRDVYAQRGAVAGVLGNGAYLLPSKEVQTGFAEVLGTVSAGIQIKHLQSAAEMSAAQAYAAQNPIPLVVQADFNPTQGYGSYVVPAVAVLILQQTLLMGTALLVGTWREQRRAQAGAAAWAGRIAAVSLTGWLMTAYYFGGMFTWQNYIHGQNWAGAALTAMLFVPAVATLGCLFGLWFGQRERALQILLFTSIPLFFLSGYAWPYEAMPKLLQWLGWLVPSTAAMQASVRFNQMGASVAEAWPLLAALAGLLLFYLAVLGLYVWRRHIRAQT